jgi:hypothetical protein
MKYFDEAYANARTPEELAAEMAIHEVQVAEERIDDAYEVGTLIERKGIFLCKRSWSGPEGQADYNVFVAPVDLPNDFENRWLFTQAAKELFQRKDLFGHDGETKANFVMDSLDQAILKGAYEGGWYLPDRELLNRMFENKDIGCFKYTFGRSYWSNSRKTFDEIYVKDFHSGADRTFSAHSDFAGCRAIRAERVAQPSGPR